MVACAWFGRRAPIAFAFWMVAVSIVPAAAQGVPQPLGSGDVLDLAAVVLAPEDMPEPGYGYIEQLTGAVGTEAFAARLASEASAASIGQAHGVLLQAQLKAAYWSNLLLPAVPGDPASRAARGAVCWAAEFATAEGAALAFAGIETEANRVGGDGVPLTRTFGDEAAAARVQVRTDEGAAVPGMEITFRVGRLVARIMLFDFGGAAPDATIAERLAARLLERATWVADGNGPRFGSRVVRVTPWDGTRVLHDRYDRWGGQSLPGYGQTGAPAEGHEATVYNYRFLNPENGSFYAARIAAVGSRGNAAAWLEDWRAGWLASTGISGYGALSAVGARGGDEAAAFAYAWTDSETGAVLRGYVAALRFETWVMEVQIHTTNGLPADEAIGLLTAQYTCFTARSCAEPGVLILLQMPHLYAPMPTAPAPPNS